MTLKKSLLCVSLAAAFATVGFADTIVIKEPEVRTIVTEAGYGEPTIIERDGNLWRVTSPDNNTESEVTVFVNAEGDILGAAEVTRMRVTETTTTTTTTSSDLPPLDEPVTPTSVTTIVMNAGFHNVHDIDFLDSEDVWKAEADDISGEDYEIHVDDDTGRIVHIEDD